MEVEDSRGYYQAIMDLREANGELSRHHEDFKRISRLLDDFFSDDPDRAMSAVETLKAIRRVVG